MISNPVPRKRQRLRDRWKVLLCGEGLLLVLFASLVFGSRELSLTADEPAYIAGGYALWARGPEAFSLLAQRGYPPLLCALEGWLVYAADPSISLEHLAGWLTDYETFVDSFMSYVHPMVRTETAARVPVMLLAVLLGAVVLRWARDLWGAEAGVLALLALAFDPTLLAHGRLATTDVGSVALGTAALYATWRLTQRRSWFWALAAGVLLGLTMLAKVSGALWMVAAVLMVLATTLRRRWESWAKRLLAQGVVVAGVSLLILWAGYAFTWGRVDGFPLPVPAPAHWESAVYLDQYTSQVFALGQRQYGRWWWYYPLAFLIKNPLPLLIGSAVGAVALWRRPFDRSRLLILAIFPVLYAGVALLEGMNIGYRHMLPIHPFLYLAIGGGLERWIGRRRGRFLGRWVPATLGAWYVAGTLWVFPHEIAYFNELVGGPKGGYRYLADSNLAWGQSARALEAYVQAHPDVQTAPPAARFRPAPGRYIVDASYLQGVGIGDPDTYAWFRHWKPQTTLQYSLLVYDVPPYEMAWAAQCKVPASPLDEATIAAGTGRDDLRYAEFDCTEAWLYPGGGAKPGMYVLHQDLMQASRMCLPSLLPCPPVPGDPFVARRLAPARLSYEQAAGEQAPAFALYEMPPAPVGPSTPLTIRLVSTDALTVTAGAHEIACSPLPMDGPLILIGATTVLDRGELQVETWWRVTEGPITRPFSVMAQLFSEEGQAIGSSDGLGVSPLALLAGDVFVQRHRFSRPAEAQVFLLTGAYWLDTMERWAVDGVPGADALLIELPLPR